MVHLLLVMRLVRREQLAEHESGDELLHEERGLAASRHHHDGDGRHGQQVVVSHRTTVRLAIFGSDLNSLIHS